MIRVDTCSPFLDNNHDGSQQEDENHQSPGTGSQNQPHVLGMLGHLQSVLMVPAGT